jgi:hypothetical protein
MEDDRVNFDNNDYFEKDPILYNIIKEDLVDRESSEQVSDDQDSGKILPEIEKKDERTSQEHSASMKLERTNKYHT